MIKTNTSKPKVLILLITCVLLIAYMIINAMSQPILPDDVFAFSPTPENGQLGGIEGVYYHRASSLFEILSELSCKETDGWDNCTTYVFLRFYEDGYVVEANVGSDNGIDEGEVRSIQQWLNQETKEISRGKYFISGIRLWFSTSVHYADDDRTVVRDYSGLVLGNILVLDDYNHSNGYKLSNMVFRKLNDEEQK